MLTEKIKIMETRWKTSKKEPTKFTAKTILAALELKSLNELSSYMLMQTANQTKTARIPVSRGTITNVNDLRLNVGFVRMKECKNVCDADLQTELIAHFDSAIQAVV